MKEEILANWQLFERRPTWGYVSVEDVSKLLQISPQSVHNYIGRGKLPKAEKIPRFKGNKGFFQIARLRSFLEKREENDIHFEWIHKHMPNDKIDSIEQAKFLVRHCYDLLGVEKPICTDK